MRIAIVGGSLAGLSAALALANNEHEIVVLERRAKRDNGAGLGIDLDLLARATGHDPRHGTSTVPAIVGSRALTTWAALRGWLLEHALAKSSIQFHEGREIVSVIDEGNEVILTDRSGSLERADLVIGADGYRSIVRQTIIPEAPAAAFAGYLLWRALIPESALPGGQSSVLGDYEESGPYRFVAYVVPGARGQLRPGSRQITFGWYDATTVALLHEIGAVADGVVMRSVAPGDIPKAMLHQLRAAATSWSPAWRVASQYAIDARTLFGTPIAEYVPMRVAAGRIALIGDAAHVATPMLGAGFSETLRDVIVLRDTIRVAAEAAAAATQYESVRLANVQAFVRTGVAWSRAYVREAHMRGKAAT